MQLVHKQQHWEPRFARGLKYPLTYHKTINNFKLSKISKFQKMQDFDTINIALRLTRQLVLMILSLSLTPSFHQTLSSSLRHLLGNNRDQETYNKRYPVPEVNS